MSNTKNSFNYVPLVVIGLAVILDAGFFFKSYFLQDKSTSEKNIVADTLNGKIDSDVVDGEEKTNDMPATGGTTSAPQPVEIKMSVRGSDLPSLSTKIKNESERILSNNPNLYPVDVRLNLASNSFSCRFEERSSPSNILKLGLYFGPDNIGCESCGKVIQNNPGSTVLASQNHGGFDAQIIAISQ